MPRRLTPLLPALTIAALLVLFFHKLALTNLIFARGDTFYYFYPYWEYRAAALRAGTLPLWNPYLFMGAPFLANSQAGVLYPPNWLLIPFSAPVAVKLAILSHLALAAAGLYQFARRVAELHPPAATTAAGLFVLGGYLTAKVEQINQLQGLAWLPLLLLAAELLTQRVTLRRLAVLAGLLALQLLAGHTQSTFITLVAIGIWVLLRAPRQRWPVVLAGLAFAGLLAGGLAAAQLLPTLELSRLSFRGGGLPANEAVSFSLHPLLLGRALLPGYSRSLFTEYVGYIGITGILLLVTGAITHTQPTTSDPARRLWRQLAVLAGLGLFLALGGYTPAYWLLVRVVPGFDLFRVPARWLVLWAFGAALLVGWSLERGLPETLIRRALTWSGGGSAALMLLGLAASRLTPAGEAGPLGVPGWQDWLGWVLALGSGLVLLALRKRNWLIALLGVELLVAGWQLPYNHLTAPDAWYSIRPAMTQLLAAAESDTTPPGRFLSMSALWFDPGDMAELRSIWEPQLPEDAIYSAIVATKAKEVLSPNLPLAWEIPAVDGYDGGILPLRSYAGFTQAFTGAETPSPDGRLREYVQQTPANWLLNMTNTRWLITDKVGDDWVDGVFYDLQFQAELLPGETYAIGHLSNFTATALGVVLEYPEGLEGQTAALAHVMLDDGRRLVLPVEAGELWVRWNDAQPVQAVQFEGVTEGVVLHGASLIDERSGAFQSLTLGPYRLAHSGDVKIYENLNVWPRAFVVDDLPLTADILPTPAAVTEYTPHRITIQAELSSPGWLVLTDAMYPGWQVMVDGQPGELQTANGLFRAAWLPTGDHTVVFAFQPNSWYIGLAITGGALIVWLLLILVRVGVNGKQ